MTRFSVLAIALLITFAVACSKDSTAPKKGIDPSVLVVNLTDDNAVLLFVTDSGQQRANIPAHTTVCTAWIQGFDSLYTEVYDSSTSHPGAFANVITPWVHFAQYPDYFQRDTVKLATDGQNVLVTNTLDSTECQ